MSIRTTVHLNFSGEARAALEFYQAAFGGDITIATYADFGMPAEAPGAQSVVFGQIESPDGFRVMAYDIPGAVPSPRTSSTRRENGVTLTHEPFFVSVRGDSLADVQRSWDALSEGGTVVEPLASSAWSAGFGMLTDRYGVTWVLDVAAPSA
ncbi:VOC family protein [Microbacterium sp. RD1]|uniref:VOC family protein n=1 Tax=Microbacterium sp. RD1 TaxID=3457313 RepID=UPI003FA5FB78